MVPPKAILEATGDALSDTIGGMFDIPEQHIVEQAEESLTLGGNSYETGQTDFQAPQPDEPWDPFSGW
jgi:hypothetical protein